LAKFGFSPELLRAALESGIIHELSIAETSSLPHATVGTSLICQAPEGHGKTTISLLSILHQLQTDTLVGLPVAIILCNTRALAINISDALKELSKYLPQISQMTIIGSEPIQMQKDMLKEKIPNILIGTPGRILQLTQEKCFELNHIKYFVIDNADKSLEWLQMRRDVQQIFIRTPRKKQVMILSDTMNEKLLVVCRKMADVDAFEYVEGSPSPQNEGELQEELDIVN